jgi:hypothetical protein
LPSASTSRVRWRRSSTTIASLGGDVSKFVSPLVLERLHQRVRPGETQAPGG